jgi:hypothetical protein
MPVIVITAGVKHRGQLPSPKRSGHSGSGVGAGQLQDRPQLGQHHRARPQQPQSWAWISFMGAGVVAVASVYGASASWLSRSRRPVRVIAVRFHVAATADRRGCERCQGWLLWR